jgi:hypothetical protein
MVGANDLLADETNNLGERDDRDGGVRGVWSQREMTKEGRVFGAQAPMLGASGVARNSTFRGRLDTSDILLLLKCPKIYKSTHSTVYCNYRWIT